MAEREAEAVANELADAFVYGVSESRIVHWLSSPRGAAGCASRRFATPDDVPLPVLLFFSDATRAQAVGRACFPDHEPAQMPLSELLDRWLPGMGTDGFAAGLNWGPDLSGPERDPKKLKQTIELVLRG